MKRVAIAAAAALWCCAASAEEWRPAEWPVLRHYDGDHLYRIALPLGGIGTGTVSLGGRGELRDWEIMNVPAKGYSTVTTGNDAPFFAVYAAPEGGEAVTLLAAGPLYDHEILHYEGRAVNHHGMPRFGEASFDAAYPFGQVHLSGGGAPLEVTVRGFNPFVPCDADASSLPVAVLVYEVENTSGRDMDVAVCGCMRNFIGKDGSRFYTDWKGDCIPTGAAANRNEYRDNGMFRGIYMYSDGVDKGDPAWGTMALVTTSDEEVSYRTSTRRNDWSNSILDLWDDFSADGRLTERTEPVTEDDPTAALAVRRRIPAGGRGEFVFFLTWNFPNRLGYPNLSDYTGRPAGSRETKNGLTDFGRSVVSRMKELGMIVDVSHGSDKLVSDVKEVMGDTPFVASHSNAASVLPHPRNLTGEQIRLIAESGGVVGLSFCAEHLSQDRTREGLRAAALAHAKAILNAGGEDVLALGSDFDGIPENAFLRSPADVPQLLSDFEKAFGSRITQKIAKDNFLRVFKTVCG